MTDKNDDAGVERIVVRLDRVSRGGSMEHGELGFFDAPGEDGKIYRIAFEFHLISRLHDALNEIQAQINKERTRVGSANIFQVTTIKNVTGLSYGADFEKKTAVLRTHFFDHTHQDTAIHDDQIPELIKHLREIHRAFEKDQQ